MGRLLLSKECTPIDLHAHALATLQHSVWLVEIRLLDQAEWTPETSFKANADSINCNVKAADRKGHNTS